MLAQSLRAIRLFHVCRDQTTISNDRLFVLVMASPRIKLFSAASIATRTKSNTGRACATLKPCVVHARQWMSLRYIPYTNLLNQRKLNWKSMSALRFNKKNLVSHSVQKTTFCSLGPETANLLFKRNTLTSKVLSLSRESRSDKVRGWGWDWS